MNKFANSYHQRTNDPRLPSWYHRVRAVLRKEDREWYEVNGCDFDEDLSELEEDTEQEDSDDPDEDNDKSERSYDGSDARLYYELKAEREQRKWEKLWERREQERHRGTAMEKEEEVRAAYKSLKKARKEGKTIPVGKLAGQDFTLFCSDHVDHCYNNAYGFKRLDFCHPNHIDWSRMQKRYGSECKPDTMLFGEVDLGSDTGCSFGPLPLPKRARRTPVKIRSKDGKYVLSFQFLGNGYLRVSVPRKLVFMERGLKHPTNAAPPETFEFVGIWRDWEKEKAERLKKEIEMRKKTRGPSPPSPKESWFEMNHPMGSWAQSHWDF